MLLKLDIVTDVLVAMVTTKCSHLSDYSCFKNFLFLIKNVCCKQIIMRSGFCLDTTSPLILLTGKY